ncbi:MAG: DNA polymerase III subunit gamma/tau [Brevinema sp.]
MKIIHNINMSEYQVTARKWRPQNFDQVIGQEHVTTALANAVTSGRVPHAYLFSGPRGVGKTSTARILAKVLNCVQSPNVCGECSACKEIASGQAIDVQEIDGASNRGIEHIRNIKENATYAPLSMKYKIFIIDEVHMLTKEASNALLKVLEEPPSHLIFMLATTEANKILPTIRSRCQHYLLKRIPLTTIVARLAEISAAEGIVYEPAALEEIARAGDGSMRDSQTIFDQACLYMSGNLTLTGVREILGLPESHYFFSIFEAFSNQDIIKLLEIISEYLSEVGDGQSFAENLLRFIRKGMLVQKLPVEHELIECGSEEYSRLQTTFSEYSTKDMLNLIDLGLSLCDSLRHEGSERFWIEGTVFKMMDVKNRLSPAELRAEFQKVLNGAALPQPIAPKTVQAPVTASSPPPLPSSPKIEAQPSPSSSNAEEEPIVNVVKNLFEIN